VLAAESPNLLSFDRPALSFEKFVKTVSRNGLITRNSELEPGTRNLERLQFAAVVFVAAVSVISIRRFRVLPATEVFELTGFDVPIPLA
jgi:hypothetical protein